jgi:hypothetical protein
MIVSTGIYGTLAVVGLYLMPRSAAAGLPTEEPEGAERPPTFAY